MNKIKFSMIVFICCFVLGACAVNNADIEEGTIKADLKEMSGAENNDADETGFPVSVNVDGKEVTIQEKPQRILPLSLDGAEIVLDLVETNRVVAVSKSVADPMISTQAEKAELIDERLASATNIDPEQILSYDVDLLLLTKMHGQEADADQLLQQAGVPILSFDTVKTVDDLFTNIAVIGKAVGEKEKADALISSMKVEMEQIQSEFPAQAEKPTILVLSEVGPGTGPYMLGPTNISYDLIKKAGGEPAVNLIGLDRTTKAEVEQVIKMDPDFLFLLDWQGNGEDAYKELMDASGWNTLKAVQNGHVTITEVKYIMNPNKEIVHGLKLMAETINEALE